jgi:hypothetical protein
MAMASEFCAMATSTADRAAWGRIGAYSMHARHDVKETSRPGRERANARFREEVISAALAAGEQLTEAEIDRRANAARKAWMSRIALRSVQARRRTAGKSLAAADVQRPATAVEVRRAADELPPAA